MEAAATVEHMFTSSREIKSLYNELNATSRAIENEIKWRDRGRKRYSMFMWCSQLMSF